MPTNSATNLDDPGVLLETLQMSGRFRTFQRELMDP